VSKVTAVSSLGNNLRDARKTSGVTQGELARTVGLAEKTIRLLESGHGNLASWHAVLEHLGLELVGRNIPAGRSLGNRLAALRRGRGLGQRELAAAAGVTQPTIVALERREQGRLDTLERVLVTLGAGHYLARPGEAKAFYTHAGNSSANQAWETPPELLQTLAAVFGRFDLDPCAPRKSRTRVGARVNLTNEDDGLSVPWSGVVFVNPPYGRGLAAWVEKARAEVAAGRARTVVALLPARPDTAYWHENVAGHAAVYFLRGRLRFGDGKQSAPFPSAIVIWGAAPETMAALGAALPDAWRAG
jgi:phage N-6-adenine-methyltransferase